MKIEPELELERCMWLVILLEPEMSTWLGLALGCIQQEVNMQEVMSAWGVSNGCWRSNRHRTIWLDFRWGATGCGQVGGGTILGGGGGGAESGQEDDDGGV